MIAIRRCLVPLVILLVFQAAKLHAATINLGTAPGGAGVIEHRIGVNFETGPFDLYNNKKPLTQIVSQYSATNPFGNVLYSNAGYLLFDLSTLPFKVKQASIQLDVSGGPVGNVRFYTIDVVSLEYLALLQNNEDLGTTVGPEVFTDLTDNTAVGTGANPSSGGVMTISLNSLAVQGINNASGLWGVGIVYETQEAVFQPRIFFNNPAQLVLNDQPALPPGC